MIYSLGLGTAIPLSFQLFNYDASKFIQVFLRDSDDNAIAGSPVQLTADSNGIYTNNLTLMPDTAYVTAQYVVYDDSGYTTVSTAQGSQFDIFILVEILPGDPLPIYFQLFDYDPSKYVKAYIKDESGNPITGSPLILSPIGSLGLYGANSLVAPTSGSVTSQCIVYDDSGYTTISTSEGGGADVITLGASLFFLELGGLPNVKEVLLDYLIPLTFIKIVKDISQFQVREYQTVVQFRGMWVPISRKMDIRERGQRRWKWYECFATPGVQLEPDDIIKYNAVQYRIMEKIDYSMYGYQLFRLIEDYTGSGVPG